jgi:hypothetical protein
MVEGSGAESMSAPLLCISKYMRMFTATHWVDCTLAVLDNAEQGLAL